MEKSYSYIQNKPLDQMSLNGTSIKYGQQPNLVGYWIKIVECENQDERRALIDKLLEEMESNSSENGFWTSNDDVRITFGFGTNSVRLDDKDIYYSFFENLRTLYLKSKAQGTEKKTSPMSFNSIFSTIENYFGPFNGNLALRSSLTELNFDTFEYPSVSVLKGKRCGACVEKAAIAHNLWLLLGMESYYVSSTSSKFEHSNDEGHAFCIIRNTKGQFMLYDQSMQNFGPLQGDPISTILSGEPFIIKEPFKNKGVYANACNLGKEMRS